MTSTLRMRASASVGGGMPAAIQAAITRYSGEPTSKRRPPMWGIVRVGLRRMRLRAGSSGLVRRPAAWRVNVT